MKETKALIGMLMVICFLELLIHPDSIHLIAFVVVLVTWVVLEIYSRNKE